MVSRDSQVTLREITSETVRDVMRLETHPEQRRFVAPVSVSIGEAYFHRETAWFRAIYAEETPVGFLMLQDTAGEEPYYLWRFLIDARYQSMGFGRRALELLIEHVRKRPKADRLQLSVVPGEGGPGPFYERLGFAYTGEEEEGELVMQRLL
jgi:diamine N-acetyltransferase